MVSIPRSRPSQAPAPRGLSRASWYGERQALLDAVAQWVAAKGLDPEEAARTACAHLLQRYWLTSTHDDRDSMEPWPLSRRYSPPLVVRHRCQHLSSTLATVPLSEASYRIGGLYTALLPAPIRSQRGAFYTPPELAERLLDLGSAEGVDWARSTILDPACGGGAFLLPVAHRILSDHRLQGADAEEQLSELERRLCGIEIDGFAAWTTRTLLRLSTYGLSQRAKRRLEVEIHVGDALEVVDLDERRFDLVVGNPPYGRVQLSERQRESFARSLYGHANLYGLFLDAALRWRSPRGLIAFVTPTSFLGGQYFHRLRNLLLAEAPPLVIDFVSERTGVFDDVQQETCLTLFGATRVRGGTVVHHLKAADGELKVQRSGAFRLGGEADRGAPWLLPRSPRQAPLVRTAAETRGRLHDLGYRACTGPLVWNRHKQALRQEAGPDTLPLIWAEAVRPNRFDFDYHSRSHARFFALEAGQDHLRESTPGVLVQRTTAKEQKRRIIACAVPEDFFARWNGIVVENHVNVLRPVGRCEISPSVLAAVLNTKVVDELFRCLSGSVAVSATELHALPLPPVEGLREIEEVFRGDAGTAEIEAAVRTLYGLGSSA